MGWRSHGQASEWFTTVDQLTITAPVPVVTSDPDAPAEPRNGDAATRARFHAGQQALAGRLGAEFVVLEGDPWPPSHRPEALVELVIDFARRVAESGS